MGLELEKYRPRTRMTCISPITTHGRPSNHKSFIPCEFVAICSHFILAYRDGLALASSIWPRLTLHPHLMPLHDCSLLNRCSCRYVPKRSLLSEYYSHPTAGDSEGWLANPVPRSFHRQPARTKVSGLSSFPWDWICIPADPSSAT